MTQRMRKSATATLLAVLALAVWWLGPDPSVLAPAVRHPQSYVNKVGADQAALAGVCALCWIVLGWLAVGLAFAAAAALPGVAGEACDTVADRFLPGALRRTAAVALGLSVATAGGGAALAIWHPGPRAGIATGRTLTVDWPSDDSGAQVDPDWPVPREPARHAAARATHPVRRSVVVQPGDSLWRIAAERLDARASDAQIAREWPRWYAANRSVIGNDPDLIRPGQRLVPPTNQSQAGEPHANHTRPAKAHADQTHADQS